MITSHRVNQYETLSEKEYANVFSTYLTKSTQRQSMLEASKSVIDGFGGKAIKLMSIGAGTGCVEESLVLACGLKLEYFYAIEPNSLYVVKLRDTFSRLNIAFKIDQDYFTPEMEISDTFDMVLMSHCLYYMEDPLKSMIKARSLLKHDGKVIIFHETDKGGYELQSHFLKHASVVQRPLQ